MQRDRELTNDRVHQPRLRRARQLLCLIDRMVDNLCNQSLVRVLPFSLDEFEACEIKHGPGRVARRVRDQFRQLPFEPAGVTHHPENEVLTTRPLRPGQLTGQRIK